MTTAATINAVNLFFNQLVEKLEKYIKEIERKFCKKDQLLYYFQIEHFQKSFDARAKIEYLLEKCLLKQLKKNDIDKIFEALMSFMKEYDDLRALSVEIEKYVEENSVPVNFSHQATDHGQIVTTNSTFNLDTFKESVPKLPTVPTDLKYTTAKEKSELVAPNHPYPSTAPSSSAPITQNDSIDKLYSTICKVLNENASLQISFSTLLCTGLPKTGKTTFSHMLLKRSKTNPCPGDNQAVFVKRKCLVTKEETHWKEVTLTDILDQLNCLTTFDCVSKVTEEKASTTKQSYKEIWSIIVLLDIHVNVSVIHLLPKALVTFVVDKFQDVKISFEKDCDSKELQHFDGTLHLLKQVISTNCLKELSEKKSSFEELEVKKGDECIYTAFVSTYDGDHPADGAIADKGLCRLLDTINFPNDVDREPLPALHVDGKLLHLVNINDQADKMAKKLNNTTQRLLDHQTTHRVPIGWLFFMIELKQYSKTSGNYYHCLSSVFSEIWKNNYSTNKDELKVALKFFHHIGLLLYLESEDDTHSYVFCNWIWLFQKIDCLLQGPISDGGTLSPYTLFMYEGILNQRMISGVSWPFEEEIEVKTLLKLLVDLHIAVPMKRLINKTTEYFIPGRLPAYDGSSGRALSYGDLLCEPLLMIYSSGTSHPSHFSFLAAHLLEKLPEGWMKPAKSTEDMRYTYSNLITFSVNKSHYVTLYEKAYFLEIQIRSSAAPNSNLCYQIQCTLIKAINTACIDRIHREASKVQLGFYCHLCNSSNKHLMIAKPSLSKNHLQVYCCKESCNQVYSITEEKFTDWFRECDTQESLKTPVSPSVRQDSGYTEAVPQADTTDASVNLERYDVYKQFYTVPVEELGIREQYQVAARPNLSCISEGNLNLTEGRTLVLAQNVNFSQTPLNPEKTPLAVNSPFKTALCLFTIDDIEFSVIEKYLLSEDLIKWKEQYEALVDNYRLPIQKRRAFREMVLSYTMEECKRFVKCLEKSAVEYDPHTSIYVTLNTAIETFEGKLKAIESTSENLAIPVEEPSEEITN